MRLHCLLGAALFTFASGSVAVSAHVSAAQPASAGRTAEGCVNQAVSSGIWRVRVTKLEPVRRKTPFPDEPETGWGVFMEWTTTSKTPLKRTTASDGGPGATETGAVSWDLYFPSGASLGIFTYDESTALSKAGTGILGRGEDQTRLSDFFDRDFPPGVPRGGEVKFWYPAKNPAYRGKPTKLIIAGESYLSPYFAPIRFKLNCTNK